MSHADKVLNEWKQKIPKSVPLEDVEQVLDHFSISWRKGKGGSHNIVVNDQRLSGSRWFLGGNLSIPSVSGRSVKGVYVKSLMNALRWIGVI
jgi:hypothetical protein